MYYVVKEVMTLFTTAAGPVGLNFRIENRLCAESTLKKNP